MPKNRVQVCFSGGAKSNHRSGPIQTSEITGSTKRDSQRLDVPFDLEVDQDYSISFNGHAFIYNCVTSQKFSNGTCELVKPKAWCGDWSTCDGIVTGIQIRTRIRDIGV
jgi:hypothetical protein